MQGIKNWINNLFSSKGNVSSKRVAFIMVVVSSIVWLSSSLYTSGITDVWVSAFNVLIVATIGGYVGGSVFGEKKHKDEYDDTNSKEE